MTAFTSKIPRKFCFLLLDFLTLMSCHLPASVTTTPAISVKDLRNTLSAQASGTTTVEPTFQSGTPAATIPSTGSPIFPGNLVLMDSQFIYTILPGDTLPAVAAHFGVTSDQIHFTQPNQSQGLLNPGQEVKIPDLIGIPPFTQPLLPDSEVVNSPTTVGFDIGAYIEGAGGFLASYEEDVKGESLSGAEIIQRVAVESSVNPRFLLALLEFRSRWVSGQPSGSPDYPIGFHVAGQTGLYLEMVIVATHLNLGYYGWRSGSVVELKFRDGSKAHLSPQLNAGSAAVQSLFSKLYRQDDWQPALYGPGGFLDVYRKLFGDPWARAAMAEPLLPPGLVQPILELPFVPGERWSLTAGPHESWKTGSPRGALDLAPVTGEPHCAVSRAWALASAPGLIVRSERNVVAIDLDGDGFEQTGWVMLYLHLADFERIQAGQWVKVDEPIGHPSCEGGTSTGTHIHIARKFNGEWLAADGPLPFVLSGWQAYADERNYYGGLINGTQQAVASPVGPQTSIIVR